MKKGYNEPIEVRDYRNKAMFRVDDEYLNGYARLCGIYATGVYNCLCRHANHLTQTSFPSIENMAEKLGIGRDSVLKGLASLEKWGIIKKEKCRNEKTGKWLHNSYTLVDKKFWVEKPHVDNTDVDNQVDNSGSPSRYERLSQVGVADTKDTHIKVTHITPTTGVVEGQFIELFSVINPTYTYLFARQNQRDACKRLLKLRGLEDWAKVINFIASRRADRFCPRISTPLQLEQKYAELESYAASLKEKVKPKVAFK